VRSQGYSNMFTVNSKILAILSAAALALSTSVWAAPGDIFYVDQNHPNASDNNPGTESAPWKTIQKAANTLEAGEKVYVKTGVYKELEVYPNSGVLGLKPKKSGQPGNPIVYEAYPGDQVIIDQNYEGAGFYIFGFDFITIRGFEIRNAMRAGVHTTATSEGIVVESNNIHHILWNSGSNIGAIKFDGCLNCIARNNRLHDVYANGIADPRDYDNIAGVHSYDMENTLIEHNEIWRVYNGVFHKRSTGRKGTIIRRNKIYDVHWGVRYSVGGRGDPAHLNQEVYENLIYSVDSRPVKIGINAHVQETGTQSTGLKIHNNVFIAETGMQIRGFTGIEIWDNILVQDTSGNVAIRLDSTLNDKSTSADYIDNNIYYIGEYFVVNGYAQDRIDYTSLSSWRSQTNNDLRSQVNNPMFVGQGTVEDYYRLQAGSPGKAAGRFGSDIGLYPNGTGTVGIANIPKAPQPY